VLKERIIRNILADFSRSSHLWVAKWELNARTLDATNSSTAAAWILTCRNCNTSWRLLSKLSVSCLTYWSFLSSAGFYFFLLWLLIEWDWFRDWDRSLNCKVSSFSCTAGCLFLFLFTWSTLRLIYLSKLSVSNWVKYLLFW